MNKIYLDQASTSFPKAPSVAQAVYDYLAGSAVNVNRGGYRAAYSVEEQIFETREQLLKLFHFTSGKGKNVIFTENITASLNVLLKGLLKPGDHVLVTAMEHNAVMRPLVQLEKHGISFDRIPCASDGSLLLDKATAFVLRLSLWSVFMLLMYAELSCQHRKSEISAKNMGFFLFWTLHRRQEPLTLIWRNVT